MPDESVGRGIPVFFFFLNYKFGLEEKGSEERKEVDAGRGVK